MIRAAVALAVFLGLQPTAFAQDSPKREPVIIGDATMTEDGTNVVSLRRTADGVNVSGIVKYPVDSPHYKEVLDHIGGMRPGETRLVPAWDDPPQQKK